MKHTYVFRKGQRLWLDQIYIIQGLANGDWWEKEGDDFSEDIIITRSIKIEIKISSPTGTMESEEA
jgi:hypothetical protein